MESTGAHHAFVCTPRRMLHGGHVDKTCLYNVLTRQHLQTGLYETPYAEYRGMYPVNQINTTLKEHMLQAFELRLQMGTAGGQNRTHSVAYNITDGNSIRTITKSLNNMVIA